MNFDKFLSDNEKKIYEKILRELENNKQYYIRADPVEKTKMIMKNCSINEKELYIIMKKAANNSKMEVKTDEDKSD